TRMITIPQATWNNWITTYGANLSFTLLADSSVNEGACNNSSSNFYQLKVPQFDNVPFVNDYTGTQDASAFYPVGTTTVTWTATDLAGNTATCSFDVTVNDTSAPTITCPANITSNNDIGECGATLSIPLPVITDNCGNEILPDTQMVPYNFNANGELIDTISTIQIFVASTSDVLIELTFSGDHNDSTKSFTIAGPDGGVIFSESDIDPACVINTRTITIPANTWLNWISTFGVNLDFTLLANGSVNESACTVSPTNFYQMKIPQDGNISLVNDYTGTHDASAYYPVGTTVVTWTATDNSGNTATCTQTIVVNDTEAPELVCQNITIQLDANGSATITAADVIASATDTCGIASSTLDIDTFDCSNVGANNILVTTTDVNGNISTCTAIVTVEDNILPTIACANNIVVNNDTGVCGASVIFADAIALDNCSIASVTQTAGLPSGSVFPLGVSTIEYTATDDSGNSVSCSFTITVEDNEPAIAVCQNITVQLDATGNATITAADIDGGSSDNCGIDSVSIDINTFDCSNVGTNNVVLTITDNNGNTSSCTAIVTVEDTIAPNVVCQNITIQLDTNGTATITAADVDGGSTDNCGIDSVSIDINTFDCSNVGANNVVLTITDSSGNTATCTAIVTVEDTTAPELVCMDITVELGADGTVSIIPDDVINTLTDACEIGTTSVDITLFDCSDIGTPVTVQVFASDTNGNISSCSATVTVIDTLAPEITCPADQTVQVDQGEQYLLPDYFATGEATAIDNCTNPVTITAQSPAENTQLDPGVYTVTLTAEDESGNIATCEFELTVDLILGGGEVTIDLTSIVLYPNPAKDYINISNPQNMELNQLAIYDLNGRLIKKESLKLMGTEKTINVSLLSAASYLVIISGPNGQITKQLIKE
ncbi:MAG: HYR domain-containing protein, partial [Flavobacteriaceae bacterium]|nr:HYR domain-containing protein [Flavobacteriaceae bacterium]